MRLIWAVLAFALMCGAHAAAEPIDAAERSAVVTRVAELLETRFYDANRGAAAAAALRASLARGEYAQSDTGAFAQAVTNQGRMLLNDTHFRLEFSPPSEAAAEPAQTQAPPTDPDAALREAYMPRNFDFQEVSILEGNVGYLRLYTFAPLRMARETAAASMAFLANTDAVIIDLRGNRGGYPDLGLFIASYFFAEPTHYATRYRRVGDRREEQWTAAELPGPRLTRQPLYILIDRTTFSGGESLAYNLQALGRAIVVGERTQGGATGANMVSAGERFQVNISDVNFTSPATGSNWENVGVQPNIAVARADALSTAHLAALRSLAEHTPNEARRTEWTWAQDFLAARAHPRVIPPRRLQALAGVYGERHITWEGGRLYYQRGENPIFELVPVGEDEFMLDGSVTARFRFERGRGGRGERIRARFSDGSDDASERTN